MPVDAIKPDTEPGLEKWLSINTEYAKLWPNIMCSRKNLRLMPKSGGEWQTRDNISHQIQVTAPDVIPAMVRRRFAEYYSCGANVASVSGQKLGQPRRGSCQVESVMDRALTLGHQLTALLWPSNY
jgi:hypothetical protein